MWTVNGWYAEAKAEAIERKSFLHWLTDFMLERYRLVMPDVPACEVARQLRELNAARLDAVPDLGTYPELRGMRELVDAEWRGTRDGAELSDDQWAAYCDRLHLYRKLMNRPAPGMEGCTVVFFPETERGPVLAKNTDTTPQQPVLAPTWDEVVINEHLAGAGVSCGIWCDEEPPESFPVPVWRLVARYCRSTGEAVEMLSRYTHFWGQNNWLIADHDGDVAMVDKSASRIGVRHSTDGFGFVTAMTMQTPDMRAFLEGRRADSVTARGLPAVCADTLYWQEADHRRDLLGELLDEARAAPSLEAVRAIMQFRDPQRGRVCYRGEVITEGGLPVEHTIRTVLWLLAEGRMVWWARDGETPSSEHPMPDIEAVDAGLWEKR